MIAGVGRWSGSKANCFNPIHGWRCRWFVPKLSTMMRFSKSLLLVLGAIAGIAFLGVVIYNVIKIDQLWMVAGANRSLEYANPRNMMLIGAGLGLVAGLLLGMGIMMPSKSFKERYAEVRKAERVTDAQAAGFSGARSVTPTDNHLSDPKLAETDPIADQKSN